MNSTVSKLLLFTVGAVFGSAATYFVMKPKYDKLIEEDRASLREVYERYERRAGIREAVEAVISDTEDQKQEYSDDIETVVQDGKPELADLVRQSEYKTDYSGMYPKPTAKKKKPAKKKEIPIESENEHYPYVVSPEEFGEKQDENGEDYDVITLHYYSDKILTDDRNELLEDVDGTVGYDSLNHFGEYEDDTVFVRNDRLKADYEILLELEKYSDVKKRGPRSSED